MYNSEISKLELNFCLLFSFIVRHSWTMHKWRLSTLPGPKNFTTILQLDLMAQRLARRAEDREIPGSSPTQD